MIEYIRGMIEDIGQNYVIIDFMGIGIKVFVPFSTLKALPTRGNITKLYTYLHVREDGFQIFGFKTKEELDLFEKLLSVNGVGPKGALSILSVVPIDNFAKVVNTGDYKALTLVPGIGKKTAERIILELKDKLPKEIVFESDNNLSNEALEALLALGYSKSEAISALADITCNSVEETVKQALKKLMK
ncbi:Holliday junction branch migration protein RuvA [Thermoanaerobacter sp. CM-CNRG TB177]|uniref:Holliday junction branch migration complex subunit RuvA n=1 Tax=Thermoanaerobacter pentosaceus TaxID=694059 RepID=A0ABT9M0I2_9THEO|nr:MULTISPECIES: Holliday junction branch migration protein RuvA [Thermoanaerobacter]MBT1279954.1 Holliday junction branch migration protein RuvA [Thermoanaerobacter sp. CM-CNRG TB177]MDP9749601.1 Holliday junction DNA helicase RuvA [Thermoanaerobacter pentosaceus]